MSLIKLKALCINIALIAAILFALPVFVVLLLPVFIVLFNLAGFILILLWVLGVFR